MGSSLEVGLVHAETWQVKFPQEALHVAKAELLEPPLEADVGRRRALWGAIAISLQIRQGWIENPEVPGSDFQKLIKGKTGVTPEGKVLRIFGLKLPFDDDFGRCRAL